MRPYKNLRTGKGYCCEHCDGPYNLWKKANKKHLKQKDKAIAKRETAQLIVTHVDRKNKTITVDWYQKKCNK